MAVLAASISILLLVALWAGFSYGLTQWTQLGRTASWIVRIGLGVIIISILLSMGGLPNVDISRWRPVTVTFLTLAAWLFYLGLGLLGLALINLIWRLASRIARTVRPSTTAGGPVSPIPRPSFISPLTPSATSPLTPNQLTSTLVLTRSVDAPRDTAPTPRRRLFLRLAVPVVALVAAGLTAGGFIAAHRPVITENTITSADLPPAFAGLRIALISDIHLGPSISGRFVDQLVDQVNAAEPDLIVLAGDLVDGTVPQLSAELTSLSRLEARYGVVLTTGNHEFYGGDVDRWMRWWRDQGIIVLDNSGIQLTERGVSIDILGIHDTSGTGRHEPDLRAAAESLAASFGTPVDGAGRFRLLIAHEPRQALAEIDPPVQFGVDVMLSGHTHGGQLWPFDYAVPLQQPVVDGIHELQGVTVVTSTGVGAWGPPVRVLAQPEVVMVTLQPA